MFGIVMGLADAIVIAKSALSEFDAQKVQLKATTKSLVDDCVAALAKLEDDHTKMLSNRRELKTAYDENMVTAKNAEDDYDYFAKVLDMVQKVIIGNDGETVTESELKRALREEDQKQFSEWYPTRTLVDFLKSDLAIKHEVRKKEIAFRDSLVDRRLAVDVYMRVVEGSDSDLHRTFDEGDRKHEVNQGASKYADDTIKSHQDGLLTENNIHGTILNQFDPEGNPWFTKVLLDGAFNGDNRPREAFAESDKREGRDSLFGRTCLLTGSKEFPEEINKVAPVLKRSEICVRLLDEQVDFAVAELSHVFTERINKLERWHTT